MYTFQRDTPTYIVPGLALTHHECEISTCKAAYTKCVLTQRRWGTHLLCSYSANTAKLQIMKVIQTWCKYSVHYIPWLNALVQQEFSRIDACSSVTHGHGQIQEVINIFSTVPWALRGGTWLTTSLGQFPIRQWINWTCDRSPRRAVLLLQESCSNGSDSPQCSYLCMSLVVTKATKMNNYLMLWHTSVAKCIYIYICACMHNVMYTHLYMCNYNNYY